MPFLPLLQAQLQSNTYPSPSSSQLLLFSPSITLGPSKPFWRGNRWCRRLGTVCRGFSLLLPASYCSPALAWVATGLQSLQRCLCPSTGHPKDAAQSTSFQGASLYTSPTMSVSTHLPHCFSFFSKHSSSHTSSCVPFWVSSHVSCDVSPCISCPQQLPPFLKHAWREVLSVPLSG